MGSYAWTWYFYSPGQSLLWSPPSGAAGNFCTSSWSFWRDLPPSAHHGRSCCSSAAPGIAHHGWSCRNSRGAWQCLPASASSNELGKLLIGYCILFLWVSITMHLAGRSSFNIDGHDQECIYVLSMADQEGGRVMASRSLHIVVVVILFVADTGH